MQAQPSSPASIDTTLPRAPKPQKRGRGVFIAATVLALLAGGLGYYAFYLWTQQQVTHAQLDSAKTEVAQLREEKTQTVKQVAVLEQQQSEKSAELEHAEAKVLELSAALAAAESRLEELDAEQAEIRERLGEFRKMTEQFRRMIDSGRLEVSFRRGRMIVELPAQVLFPSGSADLTDEGKDALRDVAKILRKFRSRHFIVGGHTDNVPVSNEHFRNNWELSTARAVNVTQSLITFGMRPNHLVAAGYGQYDPVASNGTKAGRQRNRRIEIILEPKLRELPELQGDAKKAKRARGSKAKG